MSNKTKEMLAKALKEILDRKPLDKITISDLTKECGVNRQTFYYHFHDIYDLIEWIYITSANYAIGEHRTCNSWAQGMLDMCNLMFEQKDFILKTYHSRSQSYLENLLHNRAYELIRNVVEEEAHGYSISEESKNFIADFYKFSFSGIILEWVGKGMKETAEDIVEKMKCIMSGSIEAAVKSLAIYEKNGKTGG